MFKKPEVILEGVSHPAMWAAGVAEAVYQKHGMRCLINSMKDGDMHMRQSFHATGNAFDARTRGIPESTVQLIYKELVELLNWKGFDVILHVDRFDESGKQIEWQHIHCEYDPKPGEGWLKVVTS